jgi:rare lipoprotein A
VRRRTRAAGQALVAGVLVVAAACASPGPPAAPARPSGLRPYTVNGETYRPLRDWQGYGEVGVASWYGHPHHGRTTASGERFDSFGAWTAAHKLLPFHVCVEVENLENGEMVTVRINDRGPFAKGRVIDLSKRAAERIGLVESGVGAVRLEAVSLADASGGCATEAADSFWSRLRGLFARR